MHRLMPKPRCPHDSWKILFRHCDARLACQESYVHRHYATGPTTFTAKPEAASIAVLGGGITGLVCAYFLSRDFPNARITLFEASSRLGGWLHSRSVDIGSGNVIFEQGPRNLRPTVPNGLVTLNLV